MVHFDPSDPEMAQVMADRAGEELARISTDLGYPIRNIRPFPLYVYPTHIGFIKAGGLETSKYTLGTANARDESISVDASGVFRRPEEILAHEITHAVIFRILGPASGALPLWFNEGLAQYESGSEPDDATVAEAAANDTLIPLRELAYSFPEKSSALAYAQSESAVRYLVATHGTSAPRILLHELARTGSLEAAMRRAANVSPDRFAADWAAKVGQKYAFLRLARIVAGLGWTFMALLVVVAYNVRRKQKIEAASRWEEERGLKVKGWDKLIIDN